MDRREFLKLSSFATTAMMIPGFLQAQFPTMKNAGKRLIIVQLSGGNDGLNTIIPFRNDIYYANRPTLGLQRSEVLSVTDDVGFHSSLKGLAKRFENGDLLVFNGVGYPNPNRSHFRSMDIWHTATDSNKYSETGWLGRYLDNQCAGECAYLHAIEIDGSLSLAMKGDQEKALAIQNIRQFNKMAENKLNRHLADMHNHEHENHAYLYKTLRQVVHSADYIEEKMSTIPSVSSFPVNQLGQQLKTVTQMIAAGLQTSVYYTSLSGFDTHVNQANGHARLLKTVDDSLDVFINELQSMNEWENTLVLVFSEFGRRVKENGSRGTDHGSGNHLFLLGGSLKKAGFYNAMPDLNNLHEGDIAMQIDFRQIYATILNDWLETNDKMILGREFGRLDVL